MKFLLIASTTILAAGSLWLYIEKKQLEKQVAALETKAKENTNEGCDPCKLPQNNFFRMNVLTLKDMANLYDTSHLMANGEIPQSNGNAQPEDARSIWFEMDALQGFLDEIRRDTCGKTCADKPLRLGLRIYYARYPQFNLLDKNGQPRYEDLKDVDPTFENMHTVFMVPTYDEGSRPKDFDPNYFDERGCVPLTINPDTWNAGNKILALTGTVKAKNHGSLCPPVCSGGDFETFTR